MLESLEVLVLDCQATSPNPETGHVLEMGWLRLSPLLSWGEVERGIRSYLVQLPEDTVLSRQVSRITGLKVHDCVAGLPLETLWGELMAEVASFKGKCPTVIHFARFEEGFLRYLHARFNSGQPFPFEIICTYQLARRLVPTLPGKGLRAIAGYLGYAVPELRRSAHHVAATAFIWQHLLPLLPQHDIQTLPGLLTWLRVPGDLPTRSPKKFPMEPSVRANLPDSPGVYRMLRANGDILYIGKATSLKKRVQGYFFQKKARYRSRLTMEMLSQAVGLQVTQTGSALEAALLETDLIKRYSPPYNIALRLRDRELVFFSRDLLRSSVRVGVDYPLGPFPSSSSFSALAAFSRLLASGIGEGGSFAMETITGVLGIVAEYAPDPACFGEGLRLFWQTHGAFFTELRQGQNTLLIPLLALGKQLQLQKLEELARKDDTLEGVEETEEEQEEVPSETQWTPEIVVHVLEGVVRLGVRLLKRARWFCLLSESTLRWQSGETSGRNFRLLVLQGGVPIYQENGGSVLAVPQSPEYARSFLARQLSFDVATYDRMRVLTTELRRLVQSPVDRHLQICLKPGNILGQRHLLSLFRWL